MNTLPKAYACAVICLLSFGLVGCDDLIKGVARTIVENDEKQKAQQNQAQPPAQPVQMYAVEPVPQQVPQQIPQQQIPQQQVPQYDYQQQVQAQIQPTAVPQAQPQYQAVNNVELPPKHQSQKTYQYARVITKYDGFVYMRSSPNSSAKKILKLNDNSIVKLLDCTGNYTTRSDYDAYGDSGIWCKVSAANKTGYVFSAYLYNIEK